MNLMHITVNVFEVYGPISDRGLEIHFPLSLLIFREVPHSVLDRHCLLI